MNLDEYESAWRMAEHAKAATPDVRLLLGECERAERRRRAVLLLCGINTAAVWLFTIAVVVSGRVRIATDLLPIVALQAVLTFALLSLIRRHRERTHALRANVTAVAEALRSAVQVVDGQILDLRLLFLVGLAVVPLLAFAVYQLIGAGKMDTRSALSFGSVCAIVLGANAAIQWFRYSRVLVPRRHRLFGLLSQLATDTKGEV